MAAINGMYAPQGAGVPSQRMIPEQMQMPNVIIREINNSHADFVLENCDLRFVCRWLTIVLPIHCAARSLRMCLLWVCDLY